jgi:hypothetical protein
MTTAQSTRRTKPKRNKSATATFYRSHMTMIRREIAKRLDKLKRLQSSKLLVQERQRGRIAAYESVLKMLPKGKPGRVAK